MRARDDVISIKALGGLSPGFEPALDPPGWAVPALPSTDPTDVRRGPTVVSTGVGVVVASVDWGVDWASAALRWPDGATTVPGRTPGGTRFLSLWDQRDQVFRTWTERDETCPGCQARFTPGNDNPATTIRSITTSRLVLIVGAYDGHDPARPAAPFSSGGPSRDSGLKPDLVAPAVKVLAGRPAPIGASHRSDLLVCKSGTSMARHPM